MEWSVRMAPTVNAFILYLRCSMVVFPHVSDSRYVIDAAAHAAKTRSAGSEEVCATIDKDEWRSWTLVELTRPGRLTLSSLFFPWFESSSSHLSHLASYPGVSLHNQSLMRRLIPQSAFQWRDCASRQLAPASSFLQTTSLTLLLGGRPLLVSQSTLPQLITIIAIPYLRFRFRSTLE